VNRRGFLSALLAVPLAPLALKTAASIPVIDNYFLKPLLVKNYHACVVGPKVWVTDTPTFEFGFTGFKPPQHGAAVFNLLKEDMARASRTMAQSLNEITYGAT